MITASVYDQSAALRALGLRQARLALELAIAHAVADGRRAIRRTDVETAVRRLRARATLPQAPAPKTKLRCPVGFIDLRRRRPVSRQGVGDASG